MHQHSHEQAAFRVVEDPRHDNGERDRGNDKHNDVENCGDDEVEDHGYRASRASKALTGASDCPILIFMFAEIFPLFFRSNIKQACGHHFRNRWIHLLIERRNFCKGKTQLKRSVAIDRTFGLY